ncbi:hypothetical protein AXE80_06845 [Wenyingzhuangia fucanilytica]|uniref:Uncharacterized protein n=1 Tax=Wenyingzhuangia fucanilytica TaxID=1790137 RepID=A0A1B1Y5G4_9FLAO|nr:AAA family ATPase [Wenyingzhuangia fucanilytica]ANW96015.1 hypothetical protein AXE80_06845 [Wenyingzhuangia fucanilytica]
MLFNKVNKEHILKGIQDFKEKGIPKGFGASSTYDLIVDDIKYPPKAVMAYANYYAEGREIENYFSGGEGTDCFFAYERNGFIVVKKGMNNNQHLYKLKQEFLDNWPLEKLQNMTLEEYTDTERDNSFCYWLEHKTRDLGSIVGGSSYKFGIYKMGTTSKTEAATNRENDGVYAWHVKYGKTAIEAFESIRKLIIEVATLAKQNKLNRIDQIDLGDAYKWKIAFLYSDYSILNIFKNEALKFIAEYFGYKEKGGAFLNYNRYILSLREEQEFYDFSWQHWQLFERNDSVEKKYKDWLKQNEKKGSGKVSSYLRAINILIIHFKVEVYTENNISKLKNIYNDLLLHQKDVNGKYFYNKAKSYGKDGYYASAIKSYIEFLTSESNAIVSEPDSNYKHYRKEKSMKNQPINQILYGPPGTGKTYNTINKAIAIANPSFDVEQDRAIVKQEYDRLVNEGQIVFTTFHQSMAYEDFVEGIKPNITDNDEVQSLNYIIEKGIFKQIANKAKGVSGLRKTNNAIDFSKPNYYKMSLGGKNRKHIHDWCIDNNLVALGWGDNEDYSSYLEINDWTEFKDKFTKEFPHLVEGSKYHIQAMFIFQKMKKGDIILASLGNHVLDAVGIIDGDYEYNPNNEYGFHHLRKVTWLSTNMNTSPDLFIDKGISQQSIYEFYKQDIKIEKFTEYFSKAKERNKNYVLIIDEINRGNVSAIFGELITLLEPSKRLGNKEALTVTLPYSKETFGVPNNLHIIGTMNTADRSVEALDTALRRRFVFEEMMPNTILLKDKMIEDINLSELLEKINKRVEALINRDHTIGHSYFINVTSIEELKTTFKDCIIPLLQEYFYGDDGKIGLVLGDGFVKIVENDDTIFSSFEYQGRESLVSQSYEIIPFDEIDFKEAIAKLLA